MWAERFLFVFSALVGIATWIVVAIRHGVVKAGGRPTAANVAAVLIAILSLAILAGHVVYYWRQPDSSYPVLGGVLAFVIGGVVGSFSARFVWSLFGARFGAKDPLIGVLVLAVLVVVYSLPVYQRELASLLGGVFGGVSSIKTPVVELSFAQRPQVHSGTYSASSYKGADVQASAIPRPNDPRPALRALSEVVVSDNGSDYLARDDRYIAYFAGAPIPSDGSQLRDPTLRKTQKFVGPIRALAGCLRHYVNIFPDSQLLLVDIRPVVQWFFRTQARAAHGLAAKRELESSDGVDSDMDGLNKAVHEVRENVREALGIQLFAQQEQQEDVLKRLGASDDQIKGFVHTCREESPGPTTRNNDNTPSMEGSSNAPSLSYLQPYVTIAFADLLLAHGTPDEAVGVLTQWLDLWQCARGEEDPGGERNVRSESQRCEFVKEAASLPEWFRIRAEFELNVLLYRMVGEANITYRDFLKSAAKHFAAYAEQPEVYAEASTGAGGSRDVARRRSISIGAELHQCLDRAVIATVSAMSPEARIHATMLRSLLQNENTLLRSEIHFLDRLDWADMENLFDRARALARFRVECIYPEGGEDERTWVGALEEFRITAGLMGVATADRLIAAANSVDERDRAIVIKKEGKELLRTGYRNLRPLCEEDHQRLRRSLWSVRVFTVSDWEESCSLAERAVYQLSE